MVELSGEGLKCRQVEAFGAELGLQAGGEHHRQHDVVDATALGIEPPVLAGRVIVVAKNDGAHRVPADFEMVPVVSVPTWGSLLVDPFVGELNGFGEVLAEVFLHLRGFPPDETESRPR